MKLYEYEGKELLRGQGIPVPRGLVAAIQRRRGGILVPDGGVVVKAQVLSGGRGKAGSIRLAETSRGEVMAAEILEASLKGERVRKVLVEERLSIAREALPQHLGGSPGGVSPLLACAGAAWRSRMSPLPGPGPWFAGTWTSSRDCAVTRRFRSLGRLGSWR